MMELEWLFEDFIIYQKEIWPIKSLGFGSVLEICFILPTCFFIQEMFFGFKQKSLLSASLKQDQRWFVLILCIVTICSTQIVNDTSCILFVLWLATFPTTPYYLLFSSIFFHLFHLSALSIKKIKIITY